MDLEAARQKMEKALEVVRADLSTVRTGRATPALVENVVIACYGGTQKLKLLELATISVTDHQTLTITPFDPSISGEIRNGLMVANLGLNPVLDADIIRINIPALTEERRQEMAKLARQKLENGRVMIRQIRHEAMSEIKHKFENDELSEDEQLRLEKELQDMTDKMVGEIEVFGEEKEKELLQI